VNLVNTLEIERTSFLQNLKKFRPNQTVFEMEISKKHKNTHLETMNNIRRKNDEIIQQVKLQRQLKDKGYSATVQQREQDHYDVSQLPEDVRDESSCSSDSLFQRATSNKRKRSESDLSAEDEHTTKRAKRHDNQPVTSTKSSRDDKYFMVVQPSLNTDKERGFAINETRGTVTGDRAIEDIVLDLIPDDDQAIFQKRQIEKWDRKRKKFVKENSGADLLTRFVRNEAGQKVKAQLNMNKKRETVTAKKFKDWLSRAGQEDEARASLMHDQDDDGLNFKSNNNTGGYNAKNNYNNRDKRRMPKVETNRRVKNELKNTDQIRKTREQTQRNKQRKEGGGGGNNKKGVPFHKTLGKSRFTRSKVLLS